MYSIVTAVDQEFYFQFRIEPVFQIALYNPTTGIDFGLLRPNNAEEHPVQLACFANTGNQWQLSINANSHLTDTGSNKEIDIANLSWFGKTNVFGSDRSIPTNGILRIEETAVSLTASPTNSVIYTSGSSDLINFVEEGTIIDIQMKASIPATAKAGSYETNIVFTMTE